MPFASRRRSAALLALALLAPLAPAAAQSPAGAAPPAPAAPAVEPAELARRMPAARRLAVATDAAANFRAVVPLMMRQFAAAMTAANPKAGPVLQQAEPALVEVMLGEVEPMMEAVARLYAARFTEAELGEVAAFYGTPTGRKLVAQTPAIAQESVALGQTWAQALAPKVQARMAEELRKRGVPN